MSGAEGGARRGPQAAGRAAPGSVAALCVALALAACSGSDQPAGDIEGPPRDAARTTANEAARLAARRALAPRSRVAPDPVRRILFGDLHVHTTYSIDAFLYALPLFGGEGVHPPADACDFARHCSELDFFSLNDHAEGLTPERWRRSLESLRACDARAGDPAHPDLVPYAGWEWTQTGTTPATHFGHKNVIFPGLGADALPDRPISSLAGNVMDRARHLWLARGAEALLSAGFPEYADFLWWIRQLASTPLCAPGVDTRELPSGCHESAPTPEVLFEKLAQWGLENLVIPHGLSWGIHAPPGATLAVQLGEGRHAPDTQRLLEVYSGHGASEIWDPDAAAADRAAREGTCLPPSADFLPCCWRAGEIVRERCDDPASPECEARVAEARARAVRAGRRPHWVLPEAGPEDWLDCDQVRGAFKPAMSPRPHTSAQAALALEHPTERDAQGRPRRFRFGLIASSDVHSARAGTGYKQVHRKGMTDARGFASQRTEAWLQGALGAENPDPRRALPVPPTEMGFRALLDVERGASFLYPGGLVGVHATGRDRRSIWEALVRREVYATSGPRILLWFDLLNGPDGRAPMGSAVVQGQTPRFEVRAVGSFEQLPGCPEHTRRALSPERIASLCLDECYHPSERRHTIEAIEVVRIRPGSDEATLGARIEDPWKTLPCPPDPAGCVVHFDDPEFGRDGDDRVYYVRALQEPTPAVNGANLRTDYDAAGEPVSVDPCFGGWRTDRSEDCLAPVRERAWSSPLFVDVARQE